MCQIMLSIFLFLIYMFNSFRISTSLASVTRYPPSGDYNSSNNANKNNILLNFVDISHKEKLELPESTTIRSIYDENNKDKNYKFNTVGNISTLHIGNSSFHFTSVTSAFQYNVTVNTPTEPFDILQNNETDQFQELKFKSHSELQPSPTKAKNFIENLLSSTSTEKPLQRLEFLDKMLKDYDKRAWPTYGTDNATTVSINLHINTLGPINAAHMEYGMDIYLRMAWCDPRLALSKFNINKTVTLNGEDIINGIWKPDIFFRNVKQANFHEVTVPNRLVKLKTNGDVLYSLRLTLRLACQMSFRHYPLDIQHCHIILGPYAQTMDQIIVKWMKNDPVRIEERLELPEFDLINTSYNNFTRVFDTGNFSFLNVTFIFYRQNGFHIIQTYMPTFLLVMISWVSFWLNVDATPARVTLGVTTLLTLTTVAYGVRLQLPPVSYVKAIDIWIGVCSVFVFGALLEFTLVNYLSRSKLKPEEFKQSVNIFQWSRKINIQNEEGNIKPENQIAMNLKRARIVDRFSRISFPITFFVFNVIYWLYYLYVPDEYISPV